MEFYSPNKELNLKFGKKINDPNYIKEVSQFCEKSETYFDKVQFYPHNLLLEWNEFVENSKYGTEDDFDRFHINSKRKILDEIEKHIPFEQYEEHQTFQKILRTIDEKFKKLTFIPDELKNNAEWWNCSVYKKGTEKYINNVEKDLLEEFGEDVKVHNKITLIKTTHNSGSSQITGFTKKN